MKKSVAFLATIGILLYLSPLVTGCLFISMLLIFIVPSIFGKKLESKQMNLSNKLTSFTTIIKDILSGYDIIKSYNLKKYAFKEFEEENNVIYIFPNENCETEFQYREIYKQTKKQYFESLVSTTQEEAVKKIKEILA